MENAFTYHTLLIWNNEFDDFIFFEAKNKKVDVAKQKQTNEKKEELRSYERSGQEKKRGKGFNGFL